VTDQGGHVVLKCSGDACGMRYPSPADDPRRNACPLCESPVSQVATFSPPPDLSAQRVEATGEIVAVLDNVRSALNVGTMMRSADGAALDHLYLGGLTAPADNPKVIKTALGAQQAVPCSSWLDLLPALQHLRDKGYEIWAVDYTSTSTRMQTIAARPPRVAFVVGNERAGVDPEILATADRHVHVDMHGTKSTLNVGVAFSLVAYWLRGLPLEATPATNAARSHRQP